MKLYVTPIVDIKRRKKAMTDHLNDTIILLKRGRTPHEKSSQEKQYLQQKYLQKSPESNAMNTVSPKTMHLTASNCFKPQKESGEEQVDHDVDYLIVRTKITTAMSATLAQRNKKKSDEDSSAEEEEDEESDNYSLEDCEDVDESSTGNMKDDNVPKEITISDTTIPDEKKDSTTEKNNSTLDKNSDPIMPGYTGPVFIFKKNKEIFCQFAKVLVKYLQMVFPSLYLRAKYIIRKCDEYKKENKPGFEILAFSIQFNLRRLVGKQTWKKTEEYHTQWLLQHFMTNKTFSTEPEAKMEARRIAHIGHQPLVHPSKLQGYRGKKYQTDNEVSVKNESEMAQDDESNENDDDEVDSILKDYVIVGKMQSLHISSEE